MNLQSVETLIDTDFLRRALEIADLDAVKVTLYQHTGDPEIEALPVAKSLDAPGRALLIDKAIAWLARHAGKGTVDEPPESLLRKLMTMATGKEMTDLEFEARRDLPAFKPFPFAAAWRNGKPPIPDGFKVAIIGSGFAGIAAAVQLQLLGIPYVVLERQPEPGGTWCANRYPDIRVDTMSNTYEFSFEKRYKWKEYFGRGKDVREYITSVSKKHGVYENTRFDCDLTEAVFDEERGVWALTVKTPAGLDRITANVVISAAGLFVNPKLPQFEDQHLFEGMIIHPSRWPAGLDLRGKRVAVIGNGSTGVQLLGAVAQDAKQVFVFQRTPQWISPRPKYGQDLEPGTAWLLENFPGYWHWWRYRSFAELFDSHDTIIVDPEWQAQGGKVNPLNDKVREFLTQYIKDQTNGRQDLIDRLLPDYAPLSRRPVVDNGWYRALTRDNVELVTDGIARLTAKGIQTGDGKVRDVDVIVTATGFEIVKYLWPARYVGKNRRDLHGAWAAGDGPRAYLSMMVPEFPNLFMLYGPNSQPVSGGTSMPNWYMVWSAYAARCIERMLETGKSRVEVTRDAYERYNAALDAESRKLIHVKPEGGADKSYYVNNEHGRRLQVNMPWPSPEFHRMCTQIEWDDLDFA
ncbi:MAG TPA: NAD(P)-binding domain-containing protein [Alphaproteobacteria bacterium]|nr:NAD(P)-binding domain-containing protein [Alphaproteobacteria bacterium]